MKKKYVSFMTAATVIALTLTACGGGSDKKKDSSKDTVDPKTFKTAVKNDEKAIKGGTLKAALVADTPFKGVFSEILYSNAPDSRLMAISHDSLFDYDKDFNFKDGGIADVKLDKDAKTATIKINGDVKWSDGEPLKAEDIVYTYEIVGNKDYTGVRYDDKYQNVVGIKEYHDGKANKISGIETPDDKTVVIHYKEMSPGMLKSGGGIGETATPKHYLKDVPVKDLEKSDKIRKTPVSLGPYYISKVKPGESVEYKPNQYYYQGKPKLDRIVAEVVPSASIVAALKAKKYDITIDMPADIYPTYAKLDGYTNLGKLDLAYSYVGFKLGKFDKEKGESVMNPDAKMADKKLRQAMAYAIDGDAIGKKFYHGLRTEANSLITPNFKYHDDSVKGYPLDIKKANKILDEAGYKKGKDGYRTDKKGKELVINFASMSGGDTAEPLAQYFIQQWKEIGLKVKQVSGRPIEMNSFYDRIQSDDAKIDVYQAAWSVASEPSPAGTYGRTAVFNYTRFTSDKNDELIKKINSEKSFDDKYRQKAFDEWQEYMAEEVPAFPISYRYAVMPVSSRVKNFDWAYGSGKQWETVELTADKIK